MDIEFEGHLYPFTPWKPEHGAVFDRPFAFDGETTALDDARRWLTPAYVIGAAFDGATGYFVTRAHLAAFWRAHAHVPMAFHHAAFDLAVLHRLDPTLDVYAKVEAGLVWDTMLLHRLYTLATDGHTANGEATLEACAERYLGVELPKGVIDADGRPVRTSYGRWLGRPANEIPAAYLEYLAKDVIATRAVCGELHARIEGLRGPARGAWGFVSDDWLADCWNRWGVLTHHIQLKAAIVLAEITRNGLHIDLSRRDELVSVLGAERDGLVARLREHGVLVKGEGSQLALQAKFGKLAGQHQDVRFPRTESGKYATDSDTLRDLAAFVPFVDDLLQYRTTDKLLDSFLDKLGRGRVHPTFGVLARTGRTTSSGDLNAQNLPKDDRVRGCFVPSPDHVFVGLDYTAIELVALAQACLRQFGWHSEMAARINAGHDLHRVFAAVVAGQPPDAVVTKADRDRVKPINFGKPGGMGDRSLQAYAKHSYKIEYTDEEVAALSEQWFALFPEMREFLRDTVDTPGELAAAAGLTLVDHCEHTGDDRQLRHRANAGRGDLPSATLGKMAIKVLGHEAPCKESGEPYSAADVDYFWTRLAGLADHLDPEWADALRARKPSKRLQRAVTEHVGRVGVFVLTGRLRALAGYTARHNTIFQGLTSDGAKLTLWRVWRAGHRIVNFIHDELLVEVPGTADLTATAKEIEALMVGGMREVLPDVAVQVEYAASARWSKSAKPVFDEGGHLLLWAPAAPPPPAPAPLPADDPAVAPDAVITARGACEP